MYIYLTLFIYINYNINANPKLCHLHTIKPFGVVLGSAQRWQAAQAAVDSRVSPREVHGCSSIKLPAGGDESSGIVEGVIGTPSHPTDLIMDLCQISQLQHRERRG